MSAERRSARPAQSCPSPTADANATIINELESAVMNDAVVARTAALIRERLKSSTPTVAASREALVAEAKAIAEQIGNVVDYIAMTRSDSHAVDDRLRGPESKLLSIEAQITTCDARLDVRMVDDLDAKIAAKIRDWGVSLARSVTATRVLLKKLLEAPSS